jgi:hypothetical protein
MSAVVIVLLGLIPALRPIVETARATTAFNVSSNPDYYALFCLSDCIVVSPASGSNH